MKLLFIYDLEGTTGIYSKECDHKNDTIQLRPGFRNQINLSNQGKMKISIASRVPKYFLDEIKRNMQVKGIDLNCKTYSKEDIQLHNKRMISYKNYEKIFRDFGISDLERETIVLGDFLRFPHKRYFSQEDYIRFDFNANPEVLSQNYSLNDHPFPVNGKTPLYVVLPQPWTTLNQGRNVTLDLDYVVRFIQELYDLGRGNIKEGLERFSPQFTDNQYVKNNDLSRNILGINHIQDYLIMKGKPENWKSLERLM